MSAFGTRIETRPVKDWLGQETFANPWSIPIQFSSSVTVTADVSVNTKGAWTEIFASTTSDSDLLLVYLQNASGGFATNSLMDIGIGPSGSETVIIPNIVGGGFGQTAGTGVDGSFVFPVSIPAGSRISARLQSVVSSRSGTVLFSLAKSNYDSPTVLDSLGFDLATSRGVTLTVTDTYYEVSASTSQEYKAIVMMPMCSVNGETASNSIYTLAIGSSGSETDLGSFTYGFAGNEFAFIPVPLKNFIYFGKIPAGSRLSVKANPGRASRDVILVGVPL
jgi:hypothetical protein